MKRLLVLLILFATASATAQTLAQKRAARMGNGMNLSYLDNWWLGTKAKHYSDFATPEEAKKREPMFADIAKAGFKTVRIPICFGAWAEMKAPYSWDNPPALLLADAFVDKALAAGLNVIIDLHHVEFDNSNPDVGSPERVVNLWLRISQRYNNRDPERVFFELRNEPRDMTAEAWRFQAEQIIAAVRQNAPEHTLIIGFHDWNSRAALIASKPFADPNVIYTFHYYDPFVFTHQGATWSSDGLAEIRDVPFPWRKDAKLGVPSTAKGKWAGALLGSYKEDSRPAKMFSDLKAVKDWSDRYNVPIFAGEFGSFNKFATEDDRCRHAAVVYDAFTKLGIPNAWWEWDGGFNMFKKGTTEIADCMKAAIAGQPLRP